MPSHDISDNRTEKLVDHLNQMLGSSERARFAVEWMDQTGEAQDFDETLMTELKELWAAASVRPYDITSLKTLFALVRDRLENEEDQELLWDDVIFRKPASFQKVAAVHEMIEKAYTASATVRGMLFDLQSLDVVKVLQESQPDSAAL